jgi:hypothetical protein
MDLLLVQSSSSNNTITTNQQVLPMSRLLVVVHIPRNIPVPAATLSSGSHRNHQHSLKQETIVWTRHPHHSIIHTNINNTINLP